LNRAAFFRAPPQRLELLVALLEILGLVGATAGRTLKGDAMVILRGLALA
jgi:hypothetical protein